MSYNITDVFLVVRDDISFPWVDDVDDDCIWVRDLTAPKHLGLIIWALCAPYQDHVSPVALPKLQMVPRLILLISSGSKKKRNPDTYVWVRPRPRIHKECGPRFSILLHTPCTADCLAALVGNSPELVIYRFRKQCVCIQVALVPVFPLLVISLGGVACWFRA